MTQPGRTPGPVLRVAQRAGFGAEGTKRAQALHLDGWHDMHAHALLADDVRRQVQHHVLQS